jgi:hypothetical protein
MQSWQASAVLTMGRKPADTQHRAQLFLCAGVGSGRWYVFHLFACFHVASFYICALLLLGHWV